MNRFPELQELLNSLESDVARFYEKGNKTAGIRARKGLQALRRLAQDIRMDIQERKSRR